LARNILRDFLQDSSFWLMDVAPVEPLAIPIFTPLFGFHSITAPEVTLETQEINEGNNLFGRTVIKKGSVGVLTLTRGATFFDSDFWRWTMAALRGSTAALDIGISNTMGIGSVGGPTPRRDLVLVQYFKQQPFAMPAEDGSRNLVGMALATAANVGLLSGTATRNASAAGTAAVLAASTLASTALGPFETYAKLPARAWILEGCLPTRYKTASDHDASSGQISMMELDVAVERVEEISLASS